MREPRRPIDDYEAKGIVLCVCMTGICLVVMICIAAVLKLWMMS